MQPLWNVRGMVVAARDMVVAGIVNWKGYGDGSQNGLMEGHGDASGINLKEHDGGTQSKLEGACVCSCSRWRCIPLDGVCRTCTVMLGVTGQVLTRQGSLDFVWHYNCYT